MFCGNCGLQLPGEAKFCPRCGTPVEILEGSADLENDQLLKTQPIIRQQELETSELTEQISVLEKNEVKAESKQIEQSPMEETIEVQVQSEQKEQTEREEEQHIQQTNEQSWQGSKQAYQQQYHQDSYGQPIQVTAKNNVQTFALIIAVVSGIFAVYDVFHALQSFLNIFTMMNYWGYSGGDIFFAIVRTGIIAVGAAGFGMLALVSCMIYLKWDESRARSYFTGLLFSAGLIFVVAVGKVILAEITDYYADTTEFVFTFLVAVIAVCGYFFLCSARGINPAMGYQMDQMKADVDYLFSEARQTANNFSQGRNTAEQMTQVQKSGASSVNQNQQPEVYPPSESNISVKYSTAGEQNNGILKTDRSLLLYIVLGFLTCGIYPLYILYTIGRDLNIACAGDGYETAEIVKLILLSLITCGIYTFIWYYQVGNRLHDNAPRYGLNFRESGTTILLWMIFGIFLCGIGSFVAVYIVLRNTNDICVAYNAQIAQ